MGHTQAEVAMMDLVDQFHRYTKPDDKINKKGLLRMLRENYPHFINACEKRGVDFLGDIFENKDKNMDKKISFIEFLSVLGVLAVDYHDNSHGAPLCSGGEDNEPSPA